MPWLSGLAVHAAGDDRALHRLLDADSSRFAPDRSVGRRSAGGRRAGGDADLPDPARVAVFDRHLDQARSRPGGMYARANAATLTIEALDGTGRTLHRASGFPAGEGRVITAFQAVEGAMRLRVAGLPGGAAIESDRLLGCNRTDGRSSRRRTWSRWPWGSIARGAGRWAIAVSSSRSRRGWKPRDHGDDDRGRAQDFPGRGSRILLSSAFGHLSVGAPLAYSDEYGEAIAVLGGTLAPGTGLPPGAFLSYGPAATSQTMAAPTVAVSELDGPGETLAALGAPGVFPPPLVGPRNVLTGTIARAVEKQNDVPIAIDEIPPGVDRSHGEALQDLRRALTQGRAGGQAVEVQRCRPRRYQVTTWRSPVAT